MAADLILAWAQDFVLLMLHLALDVLIVLGGMLTAAVFFIAADRAVRRLLRCLRERKRLSGEARRWAEFAAAHPDADLIAVTEDPDA